MRTQLLVVEVEADTQRKNNHEVTIVVPSSSCLVNGEPQSFTVCLDMAHFAHVELPFRVRATRHTTVQQVLIIHKSLKNPDDRE